jgi:hypothetical protein
MAWNEKTVKDRFPILVVDELRVAKFFTKIDLRNGYHQVTMHLTDIEKTVFRTHQGHCHAVRLHALMNEILASYIRKFILVLFDDMLIYSSTWVEHPQHVRVVF